MKNLMISFFDFTFIKSISVDLSLSLSDKDSKSCVITERSPNSMIILLFFESDRISINICISSISTDGVKFPKYSAPI